MIPLAPAQLAHAKAIVAAVKSRGLPVRAAHIALETALTESGLWMYANGNNPRSLLIPHDRVGWDHGSVGLFQQQVGGAKNSTANWGTTEQLMDVSVSTRKFLDALGPLARWQGLTNWAACQNVQHSAYADGSNYRANDAAAILLGNTLWPQVGTGSSSSSASPSSAGATRISSKTYTVKPGDTLGTIGRKLGMSLARLVALNTGRYPSLATNADHIEPGWVLVLTGSATSTPPAPSNGRTYVVQTGDNLTLVAKHYAGMTWDRIAAANHLTSPYVIQPGQRLVIP